uniref:LYC1 C-terminal domain-containing protein n=1 Tax=Moniliophthora roreri TaxID=221103 RepID=A0A0W0G6L5_MONRR
MTSDPEDFSSLSLFKATPEQVTESLRRAKSHWGKDFTEQEYLDRDALWTRELECAKDGKFTTWVLAPRDDSETLNFKCSCKMFKRPGIVARKGELQLQEERINIYTIGSVFTPLAHRGYGYAGHMMRLLHWILAPHSFLSQFTFPANVWGEPPHRDSAAGDGALSVLYSEIGSIFYKTCGILPIAKPFYYNEDDVRAGWIVRGASSVVWSIDATKSTAADESLSEGDTWEYLNEGQVDELWDHDAALMSKDIIDVFSSPDTPESTAFATLSNGGIESFNRRRFVHVLQDYDVNQWGIAIQSPNSHSFITWTIELPRKGVKYEPEFRKNLMITRLRMAKESHFRFALLRVFEVARKNGIPRVEVWDLPANLKVVAKELGGVEVQRNKQLPAFKWYGKERPRDVKWMFNER